MFDYNQTWVKGAIGVPSYVNQVKGHILRSRVIWGQVTWKMLVFVTWVSFEKLKSNWNWTWVKDAIGVPLYVNEVEGHVPRSNVIWGQVRWKMWNLYHFFFFKVEVQLQPNLICRCNMRTSYSVSGWSLVWLSFFELFLCELLWYWSSLQVTATLWWGSRKFTCYIFPSCSFVGLF